MDLRPTDEQQQLIEAFSALYGKESTPERVRGAEPSGFDPQLWGQLLDIGAVAMSVPEDHGGWGASMLDLELVAEQHGRALGSAPLIEAQVAARLLARCGDTGADALVDVLSGERHITLAVRPVRGPVATLVPGGAVADACIVACGDELRLIDIGDERTCPENAGAMPLADVPVDQGRVIGVGSDAVQLHHDAVDEWSSLTAGALAGIAARSLEIGVDYVAEREAFGQPIGAFQAIAHRLADSAAAGAGAELMARMAAWSFGEEPDRSSEHASMAFAFTAETARDTSYRALHFHGGYGFMLEYDVQLYYRRARAWPAVGMSPTQAYRRVARARADRTDRAEEA